MYRTNASRALGLLSIAALIALATPVGAQSSMGMAGAADRAFMKKASEANTGEIAAGMLAEQRGSTSAVRRLGGRLVVDHRSNQQQLSMLAQRLHVTLPMHPSAMDKMAMQRLELLHGGAFDSAYLSIEEQGHMKNISAFNAEIGSSSSAPVVAYAKASLPVLTAHLALATKDANNMHSMAHLHRGSGGASGYSTGNGPGAENASGTAGGAVSGRRKVHGAGAMDVPGTTGAAATGNGPGASNASGTAGGARPGSATGATNPLGTGGGAATGNGPGAENASGTAGGAATTSTPTPGH
jgi:putative membrane protein